MNFLLTACQSSTCIASGQAKFMPTYKSDPERVLEESHSKLKLEEIIRIGNKYILSQKICHNMNT